MPLVQRNALARTPLENAIKLFLRYGGRYSYNTQRQYRDVLWRFSGEMPQFVEQITPEHLDRYIGSLKMLNSSKNTMLIPIKSFFTYLHEYHDLPNVAEKVKNLPAQPPKQRCLSEAEYELVLKCATEQERTVIRFLASTGLRAQEFCDLNQNCISPDQTYLTIIGKGSRRRVVPLNETARACIPMVFAKKYTRDMLSWMARKISQKVEIPVFGPHALRHRFVTTMIRKGISRSIVAKIAGMSETILEKTYCHLTTPDFLGATDVLDK